MSKEIGSDSLRSIIQPVLQHDPFNYVVQRADQFPEPGQITHQVVGAVIDADLVIADLTGLNASALYELAIRHMGQSREEPKPVIHMSEVGQSLPFDLKDCRTIFYQLKHPNDIDAAQAELQKQVAAVQAPEYEPTNPIITARGYQELVRTADPRDKLLANLAERLQRVETRVEPWVPSGFVPRVHLTRIGSARNTGAPGRTFLTEPLPVDLDTWGAAGAKPAPAEEEDGS